MMARVEKGGTGHGDGQLRREETVYRGSFTGEQRDRSALEAVATVPGCIWLPMGRGFGKVA